MTNNKANNDNNNLHISFGPVQDFVAEARKTRDSWASSYILAYLAAKAMIAAQDNNAEIIIPSLKGDEFYDLVKTGESENDKTIRVGTLPNVFEVEATEDKAGDLAIEIVNAWDGAWDRIAKTVLGSVEYIISADGDYAGKIWDRQVGHYWYHAWAYGSAADLAARKNIRNFEGIESEPGEKCTVCGKREALHGDASDKYSAVGNYWKIVASKIRNAKQDDDSPLFGYDIVVKLDGERLCAICLIKRLFPYLSKYALQNSKDGKGWQVPINYPSTSTMAVRDWWMKQFEHFADGKDIDALKQLGIRYTNALSKSNGLMKNVTKPKLEKMIWKEKYVKHFKLFYEIKDKVENFYRLSNYDGDVLLPTGVHSVVKGNLPVEKDSDGKDKNKEERDKITDFIINGEKGFLGMNGFLSGVGDLYEDKSKYRKPNHFYALLMMDGDSMGDNFKKLGDEEEKEQVNGLRVELSKKLGEFARNVIEIVEDKKYGGVALYAGADDVMAILPTSTALRCARMIQCSFNAIANDAEITKHLCEELTISASIVFAPNNTPLRVLMKRVYSNLNVKAKTGAGRNAITFEVWKGGGPTVDYANKWQLGTTNIVSRLGCLAKKIRKDEIPNGFVYKVKEFADTFRESPGFGKTEFTKLLEAELRKSRSDSVDKDEIEKTVKQIMTLCWVETEDKKTPEGKRQYLTAEPLLLARFLAQNEM